MFHSVLIKSRRSKDCFVRLYRRGSHEERRIEEGLRLTTKRHVLTASHNDHHKLLRMSFRKTNFCSIPFEILIDNFFRNFKLVRKEKFGTNFIIYKSEVLLFTNNYFNRTKVTFIELIFCAQFAFVNQPQNF